MKRMKEDILAEVKPLAVEYYELTGKPLGVTGEIGEFEAARLLGLELEEARRAGYDATRRKGPYRRIQIKSRWKREGKKWGRVSRIDISKEFDSVMLVLMRGEYEVLGIWEAGWDDLKTHQTKPGSNALNEQGQMNVSQFISVAEKVWPS